MGWGVPREVILARNLNQRRPSGNGGDGGDVVDGADRASGTASDSGSSAEARLKIGNADLFGFFVVDERQEGITTATRDFTYAMHKR